jgi:hypothetical protein
MLLKIRKFFKQLFILDFFASESPHSKKWWFRWGAVPLHRIMCRIDSAIYRVKLYISRPDIIRTRLPITHIDADERMFHACFAILRDFVEDELGADTSGNDDEELMYRGYRLHSTGGRDETAIDLYLWYRDELPIIEQEYLNDMSDCWDFDATVIFGRKMIREPKYPYEWPEHIKEQKLRYLIEIRRSLWT